MMISLLIIFLALNVGFAVTGPFVGVHPMIIVSNFIAAVCLTVVLVRGYYDA